MTAFDLRHEDCVAGMATTARGIDRSRRHFAALTIWEFVIRNSPIAPIAPVICTGVKRGPRKSRACSKPTAHFFSTSAQLPPIRCFRTSSCWSCATCSSLQNTIHWIKSITIEEQDGRIVSRGHFKPISSRRFLNDCHEYVFHFTKSGRVEIDRLALGVPYQDKSNIARWSHTSGRDRRCRGNTWFIPYETIQSRAKSVRIRRRFRSSWRSEVHQAARRFDTSTTMLDPFLGIGNSADRRAAIAASKIYRLRDRRRISGGGEAEIGAQASCAARQASVSLPDDRAAGETPRPLPRNGCALLLGAPNFSSGFTRFPGNGRTRSKMRSAIGFAVR